MRAAGVLAKGRMFDMPDVDNDVESIIIEKLVMVYANAPSWHSLETPRQALKQYLI